MFTASPAEVGCLLPDLFLAAYSAEHKNTIPTLEGAVFLAAYSAEHLAGAMFDNPRVFLAAYSAEHYSQKVMIGTEPCHLSLDAKP